ncbi:ABC transporter substrate-binding protein [Pseudooceanicola sediminis]|uniref:ABC transporter substrate-binding protein n=1 Tax=Pseudooceanicola sediminis TaxID=2211117 RepID=A0A399IW04_9RHOB|nr:ABC transporter substrate-binding protein [Pseudooceanicola sediminis]KAA2314976.1 transporter substrate-binding domain-containing protein [Puniceibacterium sp. HSS470]RII37348.1 ABC transporter substrate-binding protein [Pseudooceanicola sediminis]|tara:strand:- start:31329 stop:32297 length:969 start_codon:yes stop_codon:yes gene_type:complete
MNIFRTLTAAVAVVTLPVLAQAEPLTFAWTPNPQTPQVDIALAKGYFEEAGVEVEMVSFPSGREGFEALLGGQVDVAFMAEFPAATGAVTGQDFAIVADLARYTGSRIIGSAKAGDFASPADLAGKRIGTTLGTNVNYFLSEVLKSAGVEAEIVNASPVDLVSALSRGDVDAIVPFPTFYAAAETALGADYRELRAPGYQPHFVLAATPEMTGEKSSTLKAFLGALAKADADVNAAPEAAMNAVSASMQGAMSPEALAVMWQDVDLGLELSPGLVTLLASEGAWIVAQGVVNADAPSEATIMEHVDATALKAVAPDAVTLAD